METKTLALAIFGSVAVHALLAVAAVLYVEYAPGPAASAELDLSSVELSFAEKVDESAAAAPSLPSPAPVRTKPREEAPPVAKLVKPLPPDPSTPRLREPEERPRPVETPKDVRRETLDVESAATAAAPRQARVDAPPKPRRAIRPEYPKGARQRGEQGDVVLEIEVGADGACAAAKVVFSSGFAELDAAAVKAARSARFSPAKAGGRAVASTARLKLTFRLKGCDFKSLKK